MAKKKVLCIMGKSGVGKSTVIDLLCKDDRYSYVISKTTREIREDDPNDSKTHIFVTPEEFHEDLCNGRIVATYVSPSHYINWTSDDLFDKDKINVYAIDPTAFAEWTKWFNCEYDIYGIYLDVPENIRKDRLKMRGDEICEEPHLDSSILSNEKVSESCYSIIDGSYTPDINKQLIENILKYFVGWIDD